MKKLLFLTCILFCLSSHSKACPERHYLVRGHKRNGYVRSDGTKVKAAFIKTYCRQFTAAFEFLERRFRRSIPKDWPHLIEKPSEWTEFEKEKMRDVLESLPEILYNENIEGFYRLKKSKDHPNPATSADGIIVIYDSAFSNSAGLDRIVAHELIHQNYLNLSEKERQDYRRATGWHYEMEPDRKFYWVGRKDGYIAVDGKTSPEEDYANNLEHFLYEPDKLKLVTPSAYEWIKKKFGDKLKLKGNK